MFLRKVFKSFILLTIFYLLLSCNSLGKSAYEKLISDKEEYYSIDPPALINVIAQSDKTNLFTLHPPMDDQSDMWLLPLEKSVDWDQDDYLHVAQAFNEYIGNQALKDWKVKWISFDCDCVDTGAGFDRGFLQFFKVSLSNKQEARTVLTMDIMPWRKIIRRYQAVYSPVIEDWDALNLETMKISAKHAVEIAEKNGGSNLRAEIADKCFVNVSIIASGSGYDGWTVTYSTIKTENSNSKNIFEIHIDPVDGNFRVVSP